MKAKANPIATCTKLLQAYRRKGWEPGMGNAATTNPRTTAIIAPAMKPTSVATSTRAEYSTMRCDRLVVTNDAMANVKMSDGGGPRAPKLAKRRRPPPFARLSG